MSNDSFGAKQVVLSGIQPNGNLHLGNYIGAVRFWVENQEQFRNFLFVADLHSFTVPEDVDPAELVDNKLHVVAFYLAAGIDPKQSLIFFQSDVPAHPYFGWLV